MVKLSQHDVEKIRNLKIEAPKPKLKAGERRYSEDRRICLRKA